MLFKKIKKVILFIGGLAFLTASFFVFKEVFINKTAEAITSEITAKYGLSSASYSAIYFKSSSATKNSGNLSISTTYRSVMKFNVASIPKNAVIKSVKLNVYPNLCYANFDLDIYQLAYDPSLSTTTTAILWTDARDGNQYALNSRILDTNYGCKINTLATAINLGTASVTDLQNAIKSRDWFGVGFSSDTVATANLYGSSNSSYLPKLEVTYQIEINSIPVIASITASPQEPIAGINVQFTANWSDAENNQAMLHICKTNSLTALACSGGSWCDTSVLSSSKPMVCIYSTQSSDLGAKNFYAFVCDEKGACSAGSAGTFTVKELQAIYSLPNGNVGIGTSTPTEKLEVDGNLKLNGNVLSDGDICIGMCGN